MELVAIGCQDTKEASDYSFSEEKTHIFLNSHSSLLAVLCAAPSTWNIITCLSNLNLPSSYFSHYYFYIYCAQNCTVQ